MECEAAIDVEGEVYEGDVREEDGGWV